MANLEEIAKAAGVSVSTASRALHNDTRISLDTRLKVEETAEHLGYTKHKIKGIKMQKWNTAGLIVPEVLSGYYARLVHVANDFFEKQNYSTILKLTNFDQDTMIRDIYDFGWMDVKCLLILLDDSEEISNDIFSAISAIKRPAMFITAKYFSNLDFDSLFLDERRGMAMGIEHLIQRGYRRIGFLAEDKTMGRLRVFQELMQSYGMPVESRFIKTSQERAEEGGYLCMREILAESEHPDAVFASYDQMAIGAIKAIEEAGLSIPNDIAMLGFDDMIVSKYISKGLTTIHNQYEDMMSIAVRVLLNRVENSNSSPQQIALKPSLIIRGTT